MKKRPYNLQLQTPVGECAAAADTMAGLVEITPRGLFGESERTTGPQGNKLDIVSRELWQAFLECRADKGAIQHTKVKRAGCEFDLMKCYLEGMTIEESIEWIGSHKGETFSHSAIGRYWKVLNKIGPDFIARL
ncbi:MAG: hypothetical protein H8E62_03365 [Planctomycetes bacterium]|nr:hypothetical protein [Planctomycetota bacterium]